jgi:hypothetical protein
VASNALRLGGGEWGLLVAGEGRKSDVIEAFHEMELSCAQLRLEFLAFLLRNRACR